jgi:hypothetical protein
MLSIDARGNVVTKIHPKIDARGAKRVLNRVGRPSQPHAGTSLPPIL